MGLVKVQKNKSYFRRFQVKRRRRRLGKTDYQARRTLVIQDKNKYNSPKYRLVVRLTNRKVVCQIMYSTLIGDHIMAAADSTELKAFGVKVGLTNYPAAYCTGLLVARRLLKKLKLDSQFEGVVSATGEDYHVEDEGCDREPFKALLDVGLVRTTTGNKVFAAMKGACDGGIHVPHNAKRFPGTSEDGTVDAAALRARIMGQHIAEYMRVLKDEDDHRFEKQFSEFIKAGLEPDAIEPLYAKAHAAIRANPDKAAKPARKHEPVCVRQGQMVKTSTKTYPRHKKLNLEQRKARVAQKVRMIAEQRLAE